MDVGTSADGHDAYDFCLRFFVELRALGLRDVVISPGSRSTPLAISADAVGLRITVLHDERVAGFHALGLARDARRPALLVCTSGTAAANYLPAVVEANHSAVPMIVCTADRPPELRSWGAGQTIDQVDLFGRNVRWFHDLPVAGAVPSVHARAVALRAWTSAAEGPVHLNWPLREPLQPSGPITVPEPTLTEASSARVSSPSSLLRSVAAAHERGLIVVGPADLAIEVAAEIVAFGRWCGWPIVADPTSGLRSGPWAGEPGLISCGELMLGDTDFSARVGRPDVVVRVGLSPTSKAYRLWLEANRPERLLLVAPGTDWSDPTDSVTDIVPGPLRGLFAVDPGEDGPARSTTWFGAWTNAERRAGEAIETALRADPDELGVVHQLVGHLSAASEPHTLVVSNSMPVRDVDIALRTSGAPLRVVANRGANGIDGVIATAAGMASSGTATTVLIGDVATVHDLGGLAAAARLGLDHLTIVVLDNDAGGIFSLLPVAGILEPATFGRLFATPHGTNLAAVGTALGFRVDTMKAGDPLPLSGPGTGPRMVVVSTTVEGMVAGLAAARGAVADALSP